MKARITLFASILYLCFATPMLQANESGACVGQSGAAYGLCTAYYDAVHCQQEPADGQSKACEKIANNFQQLTGMDITSLSCPCFAGIPYGESVQNQCASPLAPCEPDDLNSTQGNDNKCLVSDSGFVVYTSVSYFCNDPTTYSCTTIYGQNISLTADQYNDCRAVWGF